MNSASVFGIRTWGFTGTGDATVFMADFMAFEFHSAFCSFNTITTHMASGGTKRNSIFINRKVIFIDRGFSVFSVKVDKWCYILTFKVLIIRHGIMCRIQKYFRNSVIRKKRFHPEKSVQESQPISQSGWEK